MEGQRFTESRTLIMLRSVFYFSVERQVFESAEIGFTKRTLKLVKGHVYGYVTVL